MRFEIGRNRVVLVVVVIVVPAGKIGSGVVSLAGSESGFLGMCRVAGVIGVRQGFVEAFLSPRTS